MQGRKKGVFAWIGYLLLCFFTLSGCVGLADGDRGNTRRVVLKLGTETAVVHRKLVARKNWRTLSKKNQRDH